MTNHPNRAKNGKEIAVVITTEHRGVFFGYIDPKTVNDDAISLRAARNCVSWSSDVKGFIGLASTGPSKSCKIGPAADMPSLRKITSVLACTPEATTAWENAPWTR